MEWESAAYHAAMFSTRFPTTSASGSFNATTSDAGHHPFLHEAMMPSGYSTPLMQSPAYPTAGYNPSTDVKRESSSSDEGDSKRRGKACLRRYKTPSPQVLRQRRCAANERERKRMTTLNVAYDKLREKLPEYDSGRRLSKFDTLRMAQEYIAYLNKILKASNSKK